MAHGRGKHFDVAAFMKEKRKEKARLLELKVAKEKKVNALRKKLDRLDKQVSIILVINSAQCKLKMYSPIYSSSWFDCYSIKLLACSIN